VNPPLATPSIRRCREGDVPPFSCPRLPALAPFPAASLDGKEGSTVRIRQRASKSGPAVTLPRSHRATLRLWCATRNREFNEGGSQGYDIVGDFGDQFSDLKGGHADKVFKMPNPNYYLP
jgi:HAD superfamily, subfamily IIIB (Acid phosphatase)